MYILLPWPAFALQGLDAVCTTAPCPEAGLRCFEWETAICVPVLAESYPAACSLNFNCRRAADFGTGATALHIPLGWFRKATRPGCCVIDCGDSLALACTWSRKYGCKSPQM